MAWLLLAAAAASTMVYVQVRRIASTPAAVMTIVVSPPRAPELTVPAPAQESAVVVRTTLVRTTMTGTTAIHDKPPAFYLDPRPPAPPIESPVEPEPEPPVLSNPELKIPVMIPAVDLKLPAPEPHAVTIPQGTPIAVRLSEALSTKSRRHGETFTAVLEHDLVLDGFVIAERGSRVEGRIAESEQAGRITGLARLSLELTALNATDGQRIAIRTSHFVKSGPESKMEDGAMVALGAGLGGAIGAAKARGKGAAIGAAAGAAAGAATVAMTRGKPAELAVEARMTFTLQDSVDITEKLP
jgi:hypothetical protein